MVLRVYSENILQIRYVRLVVIHSDVIFSSDIIMSENSHDTT